MTHPIRHCTPLFFLLALGAQACAGSDSSSSPASTGGSGGDSNDSGTVESDAATPDSGDAATKLCTPGVKESCYPGPASTLGVGLCAAGSRTCSNDGRSWGECVGAVLPATETCNTPGDDDCDGETNEDGPGCSCTPGAETACYSGPPNTKNVGPCKAGTQSCKASGAGWGPCQGEVTPALESCSTAIDDDCDGEVNEEGTGCVCSPGASEACYEGPAGSEGVGLCKAGTRLCNDQGTAWGPCEGQALPSEESCLTSGDEDCDGQTNEGGPGCSCVPGEVVDCYSGPPATLNIGPCTMGEQVCNDQGTGYGPCSGEVTPADETCATPIDDDCDGQVNESGASCVCLPNASEPCYSGPSGTQGIGACKAGTRTCNASGSAWGGCSGEVVPKAEDCATTADEDCDGATPPCGSVVWAQRYGNADLQFATGVASDPSGNVLVTGGLYGQADFGGGVLTSAGDADVFVVKLSPQGNHLWSKRFGSSCLQQNATAIATDAQGNVIVTGYFDGAIDFGGGSLYGPICSSGRFWSFLAKFSPSGQHLWSKRFANESMQDSNRSRRVRLDGNGNIVITGDFNGKVDFGGGLLGATQSGGAFVARFDPNGNHVWSKVWGCTGSANAYGLGVDPAGNIGIAGVFSGSIDLGGGTLTSAGSTDMFMARFDANGAAKWSRRVGGTTTDYARDAALDTAGNLIVVGEFNATVDFGLGPVTTTGYDDGFVVKYDAAGTPLWTSIFTGSDSQFAMSVRTDAANDVIVGGHYALSTVIAGTTLTTATTTPDLFLARLTAAGAPRWVQRFAGSSVEYIDGIDVDPASNVLVAGSINGTTTFGGVVLTTSSGDAFVAKLAP